MTRHSRFKGKQFVKALQKLVFEVARNRGSHFFLSHIDGRTTTVPVHSGEVIGSGLLRAILRDVELSVDDLLEK